MNTGIEQESLRVVVTGHVQGVGFRYFVLGRANALHLTGWVRNTLAGDVEIFAVGERTGLQQLLADLRDGPRGAYVVDVRIDWLPATQEYPDFRVRATV